MVTIRCGIINQEIADIASFIAVWQKEDVKVISATETLEVRYEEVSEMQAEAEEES